MHRLATLLCVQYRLSHLAQQARLGMSELPHQGWAAPALLLADSPAGHRLAPCGKLGQTSHMQTSSSTLDADCLRLGLRKARYQQPFYTAGDCSSNLRELLGLRQVLHLGSHCSPQLQTDHTRNHTVCHSLLSSKGMENSCISGFTSEIYVRNIYFPFP